MRKLICSTCILLAALPLWGQASPKASPKYEVATIMEVQAHHSSESTVASYDVTVKVGEKMYLVLYTPPLAMDTVKYMAGRELLVQVNEKTITYNDILGESLEVPILSQRPAGKDRK
jgi:hypothetical protein